jgi:hypothetical protein
MLHEMRGGLCDEFPVAIGPEIEWPSSGCENLGNPLLPNERIRFEELDMMMIQHL